MHAGQTANQSAHATHEATTGRWMKPLRPQAFAPQSNSSSAACSSPWACESRDAIAAEMARNGDKFSALVGGVVKSFPFQHRRNHRDDGE